FPKVSIANNDGRLITLQEKNKPITEVFNQIKHQSGYHFFWKGESLKDFTVTVNVKNRTVKETMDIIVESLPLDYAISNKSIIIKKKDESKEQLNATSRQKTDPIIIKGKVTDIAGNGLQSVNVRLKGSADGTMTDINGLYELSVSDRNGVLQYSLVGFRSREVKIN